MSDTPTGEGLGADFAAAFADSSVGASVDSWGSKWNLWPPRDPADSTAADSTVLAPHLGPEPAPVSPFEETAERLYKKYGRPIGNPSKPPAATSSEVPADAAANAAIAANNVQIAPSDPTAEVDTSAGAITNNWNLRGFDDHTYVLMHLLNLVKLRTGSPDPAAAEEEGSLHASLKGPLPFAYRATEANPLRVNAVLQCYGEPYSFVNYLTAHPGYEKYINDITTAELSSLSPKIRLYKVFHDDLSNKEQAIEFKFDKEGIAGAEVEELFRHGSGGGTIKPDGSGGGAMKRGYGCGIKDFNLTLDGTNPHTRTRSIHATLILHGDSMEVFLKPRNQTVLIENGGSKTPRKFNYRYFDLAMMTDTTPSNDGKADVDGTFGALDDMDFKIVAEIGIVANNSALNRSISDKYSSMNCNLQRVGHVYDIGQDGTITLTIEYKGFIEQEYSKPTSWDAFATAKSIEADLYKQFGSQIIKTACSAEDATSFETKLISANNDFNIRVASITNRLRTSGKLFFIKISPEVLESYNKAFNAYDEAVKASNEIEDGDMKAEEAKNAFRNLKDSLLASKQGEEDTMSNKIENSVDEASRLIQNEMEKVTEDNNNIKKCAIDPNSTQVTYFYAGDLVNLILKELSEIYSKEKMSAIIDNAVKAVAATEAFKSLGDLSKTRTAALKTKKTFIRRSSRFEKLRILLGPTQFKDFFSEETRVCSIGDIPIPLNHFSGWLAKEVMGRGKTRIGLTDFLDSFINTYLRLMLGGANRKDQGLLGYKKTYNSTPIVGYNSKFGSDAGTDKLTALRTQYGGKTGRRGLIYETVPEEYKPLIDTSNKSILTTTKKDAYDYLVFYDSHAKPVKDRTGFAPVDSAFGIYRYEHGKSRGILKNIQYTATNIQGRKEARFQNGDFNGLKQLTEVFNVTVTTFADLQKYPGQRFYLEQDSLVPYLSKETKDSLNGYTLSDFGIGGYYLIDQVQHHFAQDKFETVIRAQWEQFQRDKPTTPEPRDFGEIVADPMEGIRAYQGLPYTPSSPTKTQNPCRTALDGPDNSAGGSIRDGFIDLVKGFGSFFGAEETFGGYAERGIGYLEGLFDVSDGDPEEGLGVALGPSFATYWATGGENGVTSGATPETPTANAVNGPDSR